MDYGERSLIVHEQLRGKISIGAKLKVESKDDLSLVYTPGVARPCEVIAEDPGRALELTMKRNTVGVVTDGSAVLGLGNIGPLASLPVMEGKALLFKQYAGIDAFPICLDTQDTDEIIETVRRIAPVFGGINLEDISAPRCFEVEARLQDIGIPVFHDDQHGTAIVLLAAIINAAKVVGKDPADFKVVINGAGAAGTAIATLLRCIGQDPAVCTSVEDVIICDSKGIIHRDRENLTPEKEALLTYSNRDNRSGSLKDALKGADVFVGVSKGGILKAEDIRTMADNSIVLAMANPEPEIFPDEAKAGGAAVVGTGRSDFPNQVNNVLAFPGIFRGALDVAAPRITPEMKIAAAHALAEAVKNPQADKILPSPLDSTVAPLVAKAVAKAAGS
ncbi:NAD(P)-dependent malic enzyme [Haloferula sp.]|uniref:NAD(P)-dependent malic enzyme n=1 Tax=Haloferula sp. TaxID=2497595 RepID=UPI0032A0D79E